MDVVKRINLRNIVIFFTVSSILLTLVVVGVAINIVLSDLYGDRAQSELQHAYKLASEKLDRINKNISSQSLHLSTHKSVVATSYFVSRYQDKNNYQPLVFDNDKKKVANELLQHINLTSSGQIAVYGGNGELIAYAIYDGDSRQSGITTYENKLEYYLVNNGLSDKWTRGVLPFGLMAKTEMAASNDDSTIFSGKSIYRSTRDGLSIENSRLIIRKLPDGRVDYLGVVKVFALLGSDFFQQISGHTYAFLLSEAGDYSKSDDLLFSFEQLRRNSILFSKTSTLNTAMLKHDTHFVQSYLMPAVNEKTYLLIAKPKLELVAILNKTRTYLVFVFFITAIFIIFLSIYLLNKVIVKPINALVDRAEINENDGYPEFPVDFISNEIYQLGNVLNKMVDTIRRRGSELAQSEELLKRTQKMVKLGSW